MARNPKPPGKLKVADFKVTGKPSLPNASGRDPSSPPEDVDQQLPHERDETATAESVSGPDPKMLQAHKDMKRGLVDTGRRSAYGLSDGSPTPKADSPSPKDPKD